ncbi:hypothetical protein M408DRAFT_332435 [Serendipita vermifera MAFF 305830]|uniref:Ubiquitin-like domain-containing protein n=1 Tax=Serendipita vermifera MAFF 305830 TaxID=933852 RepID=A0A0C3AVG3_SERVB|nr:hypothetical protein M408DRAFT_332435 [Serendipita vermifera MAFF 305830]
MSTNRGRQSLSGPLDSGPIDQPRLVVMHLGDRKLLTTLSPQLQDVKNDAIRLFYIPNDLDVRISAKHPLLGDEKAEIDPVVWPLVVNQISAIWVSTCQMPVVRLKVDYPLPVGWPKRQYIITATPYSTILKIKEKVLDAHMKSAKYPAPYSPAQALFEESLLSDRKTLQYYNIRDGCEIQMTTELDAK